VRARRPARGDDDDRGSVGGRAAADAGGLAAAAVPVAAFGGGGGGVSGDGGNGGAERGGATGSVGMQKEGGGEAPASAACASPAAAEHCDVSDGGEDDRGGVAGASITYLCAGAARVACAALPSPPPLPSGGPASPPFNAVEIFTGPAAACPTATACAAVSGALDAGSHGRNGGGAGNCGAWWPALVDGAAGRRTRAAYPSGNAAVACGFCASPPLPPPLSLPPPSSLQPPPPPLPPPSRPTPTQPPPPRPPSRAECVWQVMVRP